MRFAAVSRLNSPNGSSSVHIFIHRQRHLLPPPLMVLQKMTLAMNENVNRRATIRTIEPGHRRKSHLRNNLP
jgi:hypothetical protein